VDPLIPFVTTSLSIPASRIVEVSAGLATGAYERIGGVIRESGSGRIVLWLRPGSAIESTIRLVAVPNLLSLTFSAISLEYVRQKISVMEKEIKRIGEQLTRIENKLHASYMAQLNSALAHAQVALAMKGERNRVAACNQAIENLIDAEHLLATLFDASLDDRSLVASALLRGMALCYVAGARCMIAIGEEDGANIHLSEGSQRVANGASSLFTNVLSPRRALFMRPELAGEMSLMRLTELSRMAGRSITESELFDELREEIWATSGTTFEHQYMASFPSERRALEPLSIVRSWVRSSTTRQGKHNQMVRHASEIADDIESVLETSARLRGYAIELSYLREHNIDFSEWAKLTEVGEEEDLA